MELQMNSKKVVLLSLISFALISAAIAWGHSTLYAVEGPPCPSAPVSSVCPSGDTLYLVSFSVPQASLESVFEEAFLNEGRLRVVFRGLPQNDGRVVTLAQFTAQIKKTVKTAIAKVKRSGAFAPGKLRIAIDPRAYTVFDIDSVPAFVFCNDTSDPRIVVGDVGLEMAKNYLQRFPHRPRVLYGHTYPIKEKDLRVLAIDFTNEFIKTHFGSFDETARVVSKNARKKFLTGYRLPPAASFSRREVRLADMLLSVKDQIIQDFKQAFGLDELPQQVEQVLNLSPDKAQELAALVANVEAGQEIVMADSQDPQQMAFALARLKANEKAVALLSGPMEDYFRRYYPRIFPLHDYEAAMWDIRGLPARLFLNKQGVIVIEEGIGNWK